MTMVDDRGRVLGRYNAVDAFIVAVLLVLTPLAYAAYALFRTPPAKLTAVAPRQLAMGPNLRVRIEGTNLRPFMRVSFNTIQGRTFMIGSTTTAEVDLPDLQPGTYDVVLYDYAQEVDRLPKALTILAPVPAPTVAVTVAGAFIGVNSAQADAIRTGSTFAGGSATTATALAAGPRRPGSLVMRSGDAPMVVSLPQLFDVPAVLRFQCYLENNSDGSVRCVQYGPLHPAYVTTDSVLSFSTSKGEVNFQVAEVHPDGAPQFLRVRVRPQISGGVPPGLRPGDVDSTMPAYDGAWIGRVEEVGADVTLRLPVQELASGWKYRQQVLKVGGGIRFETVRAVLNGIVVDMTPEPQRTR